MMKRTGTPFSCILARLLSLPVMLAAVWVLAFTGSARGEMFFSLEPAGAGMYIIKGTALEQIAALDFTVTYDIATARSPRVEKGSFVPGNATFIANTAIPGELRVMIIRNTEIAGSGVLATLTFEKIGAAEPRILTFKSSPVSIAASPLDAQSRTGRPSEPGTPPPPVSDTPDTLAPDTTGLLVSETAGLPNRPTAKTVDNPAAAVESVPGTVSFPGEEKSNSRTAENDRETGESLATAKAEHQALPGGETAAEQERPHVRQRETKKIDKRYSSVLGRFRDYSGERNAAPLLALFAPEGKEVLQNPQVAISDGTRHVTILFVASGDSGEVPSFILEKAQMIDVQPEGRGWLLTLLPNKGTLQARVHVAGESYSIDYPLAVAPPLPAALQGIAVDQAGFSRFLSERGTLKEPKFDLNGDGERNYIDDYIFAANLRAAGEAAK
jgi:hypothetical protein